ncbi:aldo/keto reductase [Microbacterium sp. KR10-403]|uniref:aldo/keto reductase n=1 Tax=Microbacterium sp. KR10-403 TaxID=3158581 RepID=UPI0032E45A2A
MTIPTRTTGPTGITVSELALGSWNTWDRAAYDTVVQTLRAAMDAGVTTFDVGIYGPHLDDPDPDATEMVFARAMAQLKPRREDIRLAVKAWLPQPGIDAPTFARQLDAMLERQHTDYADVLVLGDLMAPRDDYSAFLVQLAPLLLSGRTRAWAVNNWSAAEVAEITGQAGAAGIAGPDYAQLKYGLTRRSIAEGAPYRELHEAIGVRVQASDVFEGGLIFGPRTDGTARMIGGDIGGTQARITAGVAQIREAAASLHTTVAALAVAVPLLNPITANVLVGARTPAQLRDALAAFTLLQEHAAEEIRAVADAFWFDRDTVAADASWGTRPDDDPATYVVQER